MEPSAATANSPLNSGLRQTTIRTETPGVSTLPSLDESGAWPWSTPGTLPPMSREANTRAGVLMDRLRVIVGVWARCSGVRVGRATERGNLLHRTGRHKWRSGGV